MKQIKTFLSNCQRLDDSSFLKNKTPLKHGKVKFDFFKMYRGLMSIYINNTQKISAPLLKLRLNMHYLSVIVKT